MSFFQVRFRSAGEMGGDSNLEFYQQISQRGSATDSSALDAKDFSTRCSWWDFDLHHITIDGGHLDRGAQCCFAKSNRDLNAKVVTIAAINLMFRNPYGDDDITRLAAIGAWVTFATQPDFLPVLYSRWHPGSQFLTARSLKGHICSGNGSLEIDGHARDNITSFRRLAIAAKATTTAKETREQIPILSGGGISWHSTAESSAKKHPRSRPENRRS